jgi:hypothetical protein
MLRYKTSWWIACGMWLGIAAPAPAQLQRHSSPVSRGSRPLSEDSANVGAASAPVHDRAPTIGESSLGPVKSGPVSDPETRSMLSGPVSEASRGPVTSRRAMTSGSVGGLSAGAVKKDIDRPLGERISDPLTELEPLQETLRALRQGRVPPEAVEERQAPQIIPGEPQAAASALEAPPAADEGAGEMPAGGSFSERARAGGPAAAGEDLDAAAGDGGGEPARGDESPSDD